jgi:hypothetical protein
MDDVHATHRTTSIVEHPLFVQIDMARVETVQLCHYVVLDGTGIVAMLANGAFGEVVEVVLVEDEELVDIPVENVEKRQQYAANDQTKRGHLGSGRNRCSRDVKTSGKLLFSSQDEEHQQMSCLLGFGWQSKLPQCF